MKRWLGALLLLLVVVPVQAAQTTHQLVLPAAIGSVLGSLNEVNVSTANNDLFCLDFIPPTGITDATEVGWIGGDTGGTFGVAVYKADGGSLVFSATAASVASKDTVVHVTVSSFTIWAGNQYRFCWCSETNGGGWRAVDSGSAIERIAWYNAFGTIRFGEKESGSGGCAAGVPPATATSLTAITGSEETNTHPPIVMVGTAGQVVTTTTSTTSSSTSSSTSTSTTTSSTTSTA